MKKWTSGLASLLFCAQLFAQDLAQIKNEKPFRWTGVLNAGTDFYTNSGDVPFRSDRFAWRISGNPTAYLYGFDLPFSFTLGQQIRDVRSEEIVLDSHEMGEYHGAEDVITPRFLTRLNFAGKATAGYNSQNFGLNFSYEHIDPEYATMGAYFFANDIEKYTVSPMFAFGRSKARLFGSYGVQRNNLLGNRS